MISENSKDEIRLAFIVITLTRMDDGESFDISERAKYEKIYQEITGETWAKTKFSYLSTMSRKDNI